MSKVVIRCKGELYDVTIDGKIVGQDLFLNEVEELYKHFKSDSNTKYSISNAEWKQLHLLSMKLKG